MSDHCGAQLPCTESAQSVGHILQRNSVCNHTAEADPVPIKVAMDRQGGRKRGAEGAATAAGWGGRALVNGHELAVMPKQRTELGEVNGCWAPPVVAMSRLVHAATLTHTAIGFVVPSTV